MTKKRIIFASVAALSITVLSACNTVEGLGRDIQSAGGAISNTSSETKDRMNNQ